MKALRTVPGGTEDDPHQTFPAFGESYHKLIQMKLNQQYS